MTAVELDPLAADDHQRNLRAVLAGIKDLPRVESLRVELHLRLAKQARLAGLYVVAKDRAGRGVAGERVKGLVVIAAAAKPIDGAQPGQPHVANMLAGQVEDADGRARIVQIA